MVKRCFSATVYSTLPTLHPDKPKRKKKLVAEKMAKVLIRLSNVFLMPLHSPIPIPASHPARFLATISHCISSPLIICHQVNIVVQLKTVGEVKSEGTHIVHEFQRYHPVKEWGNTAEHLLPTDPGKYVIPQNRIYTRQYVVFVPN
jgi:hypothetical protein